MCMPDIYQSWHETHIKGPWTGGASIAGNCPNHEVYVADLVLKRKDVRGGVDEAVSMTNPDRIGLSAMSFQYPSAVRIGKYIQQKYGIPIALGGYHATALREEIAESEEGQVFDFVFSGESEHTFKEFLDGKPHKDISGLSFKDERVWVHNKRHNAISYLDNGLDTINIPKRDSRLWKGYHFMGEPYDTAEFSRGCNFDCTFCSVRVMLPRTKFKAYNLDRVIKDLKNIQSRGTKSVFFTDDNSATDPELFKEFLTRKIAEGLNDIHYSGMVSTASMGGKNGREITDLMKRAGWNYVFLGVENIYQGNLRNMKKASSEKLAGEAIRNLYESGITTLAGMIIGNPDDTEEIIRQNFEWFHNQPVDWIMPQFLTPYPGTPMRKKLIEEGLVINDGTNEKYGGWSTYNGEFAQTKTRSGLMPEDMEAIVVEEFSRFSKCAFKRAIRHQSSFSKNNAGHLIEKTLKNMPGAIIRRITERNFSSAEKAESWRERKIAMNQFNI